LLTTAKRQNKDPVKLFREVLVHGAAMPLTSLYDPGNHPQMENCNIKCDNTLEKKMSHATIALNKNPQLFISQRSIRGRASMLSSIMRFVVFEIPVSDDYDGTGSRSAP